MFVSQYLVNIFEELEKVKRKNFKGVKGGFFYSKCVMGFYKKRMDCMGACRVGDTNPTCGTSRDNVFVERKKPPSVAVCKFFTRVHRGGIALCEPHFLCGVTCGLCAVCLLSNMLFLFLCFFAQHGSHALGGQEAIQTI